MWKDSIDNDETHYTPNKGYIELREEIAEKFNKKFGEGTVKLELKHSYSNMLQIIEKNPKVLIRARTAIESVGIITSFSLYHIDNRP